MTSKTLSITLSKSQAKYRYWHIPKSANFFPDEPTKFTVEFAGKTFTLTTKYGNCIPAIDFYEKHKFLDKDRIIFTKKKENLYLMEAPDTKLYPQLPPLTQKQIKNLEKDIEN